jgi:integrase
MEGKARYYLENKEGKPIEPVLKFLKFKDNMGYARNTLRNYTHHLKLYFEYLENEEKGYEVVNIDDLARFVSWLQNPWQNQGVIFFPGMGKRKPQTVNKVVDTVVKFYEYLLRHEEYEGRLPEVLAKFIKTSSHNHKGLLYGIARSNGISTHELRLREPQKQLRTVAKENVGELLRACHNDRDTFLLYLLFETGIRIGEALSLWIEDFDPAAQTLSIKDRGELENQAEIKTVTSPRTLNMSRELLDAFMEYVMTYHTEEVTTNHVFIKLYGKNATKPMDYVDVDNLFRRLREATRINVTPHMFRHTSLSLLHQSGWEAELLRIRAGHKNIYTTINTYVHPTEEELTEAWEKTSSVFTEVTTLEVTNNE